MTPGDLTSITGGAATLIALISIAFGLLNCFFGYRIFRIMLGVYGFILGAVAGFGLVSSVASEETLWLLLGAVIGGLLGAALMVVFYFIGVFLVGGLAGALVADTIGQFFGVDLSWLVLIIAAVTAGVMALFFQRYAIILATTLSGAWTAVGGTFSLISGRDLQLRQVFALAAEERVGLALWIVLVIWLVLAAAGIIVQLRTTAEPEA
ncbi:MAG: DUF4203 domain-containing protein [Anaerolineae bacterium]